MIRNNGKIRNKYNQPSKIEIKKNQGSILKKIKILPLNKKRRINKNARESENITFETLIKKKRNKLQKKLIPLAASILSLNM